MRGLSWSVLIGFIPLLGGCLVSLDESLWQKANDASAETEMDVRSTERQTDSNPDSLEPDTTPDTAPDTTADTAPDTTADLPLDVTPDLPLDVTPPLDVAPPDMTPDQCVDQCPAGATRCHTSAAMQSCLPAPSGCLDWGLPVSCPPNQACANEQCAPTCTDQCNSGERRCVDLTTEQRCEMTSTGCRDWATPDSCEWDQRCFAGLCLLVCSPNGIPMPCDPLSAQGSGCFEGNCYITSNGPACLCPAGTAPDGGSCEFTTDCEPAHVCVGAVAPGVCRPTCDPSQPVCAVGDCITITTYPEYGYCQP